MLYKDVIFENVLFEDMCDLGPVCLRSFSKKNLFFPLKKITFFIFKCLFRIFRKIILSKKIYFDFDPKTRKRIVLMTGQNTQSAFRECRDRAKLPGPCVLCSKICTIVHMLYGLERRNFVLPRF